MSLADNEASPEAGERRGDHRIDAALSCCVEFEDGARHECISSNLSLNSVALKLQRSGAIGERAVIDIAGIGRLDGTIIRTAPGIVVLRIALSERRRGWLLRRIEIINSAAKKSEPKEIAPTPANTNADMNMRRFCQNLENVVKDLVSRSAI